MADVSWPKHSTSLSGKETKRIAFILFPKEEAEQEARPAPDCKTAHQQEKQMLTDLHELVWVPGCSHVSFSA